MKILILVVILLFLIRLLIKQSSKAKYKGSSAAMPEAISLNGRHRSESDTDTGMVTQAQTGGWIINPDSTFPLTLTGIEKEQAIAIKELLESGYQYHMTSIYDEVASFIARTNLTCVEIEDYITRYEAIYRSKIDSLIANSAEWSSASEKDREDILMGFKGRAIAALEVYPNCEIDLLFDNKPDDLRFDDALVDRYGFEIIKFYLRNFRKGSKLHTIPANHSHRAKFEKLVGLGLAVRGAEIAAPIILENMKLKDLNQLISDLNAAPFKRKDPAIEFIKNLPDVQERLKKALALRELFIMLELPEEFSYLSIQRLCDTWKYYSIVAELLTMTFIFGGFATRDKRKQLDLADDFFSGWNIDIMQEQLACPYCMKMAKKKYPKNNRPIAPFHIGCRCSVTPIFR